MPGTLTPELSISTKFRSVLILLALITSVDPAPAQVTLGMAQTNNQILLYWPITDTSFVLQSNTNLTSTNWVLAIDAVPWAYGSQSAIVPRDSKARFFRLIQAPPTTLDGMALIPAGSYTMGDSVDHMGNSKPTNVYVSAFYMETNLVKAKSWQTVYGYAAGHGYDFENPGSGKAGNHPVQTVNWWDCVKWCNARSEMAGLTPVYYTDPEFTQVYTSGRVAPYPNWVANGYRLPTEAEYEKAMRGGLSKQRFPWGNDLASESLANYRGNTTNYPQWDLGPNGYNATYATGALPYTSPVGSFAPNGYGLYDMGGNVYKWCWDWYDASTLGQPTTNNPTGPATGTYRMALGGSWNDYAYRLLCGNRGSSYPYTAAGSFGFRCARRL